MNYILEIKAFYDWLEVNQLPTSAIALWHGLMHMANKTGWKDTFTVAIVVLEIKTGLKKQAILNARNILQNKGLITFTSRGGNQSAVYTMCSLLEGVPPFEPFKQTQTHTQNDTQGHTQTHTQSHTQEHTINKLNKTKLNNNNSPLPPLEGEESQSNPDGESLVVQTATDTKSHSKTRGKHKRQLTQEQTVDFERFWSVWPCKISRGQAEKAWVKMNPEGVLTESIVLGVEKAKKQDRRFQEHDYTPHASTWLRAKGWEDDFSQNISSPVHSDKEPKRQNRFVNFEQRQWDFSELERLERERLQKEQEKDEGK